MTSWEEVRRSAIVHGALPVLAEVAASVGCRGDPQPRHARRQLRHGLAGGRPAPGAARDRRRARGGRPARDEADPGRRVLDGVSADGARGRRSPGGRPDPAGARAAGSVPQGGHAPGAGDRQGVDRGRLAGRDHRRPAEPSPGAVRGTTSASPSGRSRSGRSAPPEPRRCSRDAGRAPRSRSRRQAAVEAEISPIDDVRSTAAYRRAVTGRILRRIVIDAAG